MPVDTIFVCIDARGHVGRTQQQFLQLVKEKKVKYIRLQFVSKHLTP